MGTCILLFNCKPLVDSTPLFAGHDRYASFDLPGSLFLFQDKFYKTMLRAMYYIRYRCVWILFLCNFDSFLREKKLSSTLCTCFPMSLFFLYALPLMKTLKMLSLLLLHYRLTLDYEVKRKLQCVLKRGYRFKRLFRVYVSMCGLESYKMILCSYL